MCARAFLSFFSRILHSHSGVFSPRRVLLQELYYTILYLGLLVLFSFLAQDPEIYATWFPRASVLPSASEVLGAFCLSDPCKVLFTESSDGVAASALIEATTFCSNGNVTCYVVDATFLARPDELYSDGVVAAVVLGTSNPLEYGLVVNSSAAFGLATGGAFDAISLSSPPASGASANTIVPLQLDIDAALLTLSNSSTSVLSTLELEQQGPTNWWELNGLLSALVVVPLYTV